MELLRFDATDRKRPVPIDSAGFVLNRISNSDDFPAVRRRSALLSTRAALACRS